MTTLPRLLPAALVLAAVAPLVLAQKTPEVRLDAGTLAGSSGSYVPKIVASGSTVYAVWQDERSSGWLGPTDIYFARSLDGGATWLAEVRLDTGSLPGVDFSYDSSMALSGTGIFVAYADGRNANHFGDIYFNRSLDGGATWLPSDARIDHGTGSGNASVPEVAASGSLVYACWLDDRNSGNPLYGPTDVFFNRSLDGGTTWVPFDLRLDTGKTSGVNTSFDPQMAADGTAVYVAWADTRNSSAFGNGDVFLNRSLDRGTTWLPVSVRLDLGSAPGSSPSLRPRIAASGSTVCVAWADGRNGWTDIYANRSLDGGTTWLPADVRVDTDPPGASSSNYVDLAVSGSLVYLTWVDGRGGKGDIYFSASADGGATWLDDDVRIDLGRPAGRSKLPQVAAEGASVFVAWQDERNGSDDVYFNRSIDGGATWLSSDVRLDVGSTPGSHGSANPRIAASGSSAYVAWEDRRNGLEDVYFDLALGAQPYGSGTPGTGGFVPRIAGSGQVSIGGTASVDVSEASGGALCALVYGFAGPATISSAYGTLLLAPPWGSVRQVLAGAPGAPGAGSASFQAAIPDDLALLGLRVSFQAGILDSGGLNGVALSNALELWIL